MLKEFNFRCLDLFDIMSYSFRMEGILENPGEII